MIEGKTSNRITVMEVSPRDGLQNEELVLSTDQKLELIRAAISAGLERIEVASFVNPKKVPQMENAENVCAGLADIHEAKLTGLVLNERGYQRLRDTCLHEAGIVIASTDSFGIRNQGMDLMRGLDFAKSVLRDGQQTRFPVQVTLAVAFGCPFETSVPETRILKMVEELVEFQPVEIGLADTIGVAGPGQVNRLFGRIRERFPQVKLRAHFHDTRNTGMANAYAAILSGVDTIDSSIGGIGGCPFAPNATGNIATEDLLYMLDTSGVDHRIESPVVVKTAKWLEQLLGKSLPSAILRVGRGGSVKNDQMEVSS